MVFLQLTYPLTLFVKRKEFHPAFRFLHVSSRGTTLAVESDVKTITSVPPRRATDFDTQFSFLRAIVE